MTAPTVVEIKKRVNADCVERLEELLEMARRGEIQDLAACMTTPDRTTITTMTETEEALLRLSGVSRLLHRLHLSLDETVRSL